MTAAAAPVAGPVPAGERVAAIDTVRGLAVLGILVMNVVEFAWPFDAYENPAYAGGDDGADLATWFVQVALFDGRMRALFSMLFGAGIVLIAERLERTGRAASAADVLLRRCLWLAVFGAVHRFGLQWSGDILWQYGLLGLVAVGMRNLRPRAHLLLALACMLAFVPIALRRDHRLGEVERAAAAAAQAEADGKELTREQQQARDRWRGLQQAIPPKPKEVADEVAAMRQGYPAVFRHRWDYHHQFQSDFLYYYFVWDVLGMLFLGMALLRSGFFHAAWSTRAYALTVAAGLAAAAVSIWWGVAWRATGFSKAALGLQMAKEIGYPFVRAAGGLGWAAALLLVLRAGRLRWLVAALGDVGRMAFTNYILQTVCCTLLFFGYGLGWYGSVPRAQLMLVVLAVSVVQVVASRLWLRWFRFGPLEWAWRSLTWWQWQPIGRERAAPPPAEG